MANLHLFNPNVRVAKGYVEIGGVNVYCTIDFLGSMLDGCVVKLYPKVKGYSYSYCCDGKKVWNKSRSGILSCELPASYFHNSWNKPGTMVDILIKVTNLNIFIESNKY